MHRERTAGRVAGGRQAELGREHGDRFTAPITFAVSRKGILRSAIASFATGTDRLWKRHMGDVHRSPAGRSQRAAITPAFSFKPHTSGEPAAEDPPASLGALARRFTSRAFERLDYRVQQCGTAFSSAHGPDGPNLHCTPTRQRGRRTSLVSGLHSLKGHPRRRFITLSSPQPHPAIWDRKACSASRLAIRIGAAHRWTESFMSTPRAGLVLVTLQSHQSRYPPRDRQVCGLAGSQEPNQLCVDMKGLRPPVGCSNSDRQPGCGTRFDPRSLEAAANRLMKRRRWWSFRECKPDTSDVVDLFAVGRAVQLDRQVRVRWKKAVPHCERDSPSLGKPGT